MTTAEYNAMTPFERALIMELQKLRTVLESIAKQDEE